MSLNLHPLAEKSFNQKAFELVAMLTESVAKEVDTEELLGSRAERPSVDWSDKVVDAPFLVSSVKRGDKINIFEQYAGKSIGLNESCYPTFEKFVKNLHKNKSVADRVSYDFLFNATFKWLINVHKTQKAEEELIAHLSNKIAEVTGDYTYSFKTLNLDIEKNFNFGNVRFEFLDSSFFDQFAEKKSVEDMEVLREKFKGQVYASCTIKNVEQSRGVERALEECYKSMNVLKLFTPTILRPDIRTYFEIDRRITAHESIEHLIRDVNNREEFTVNLGFNADPFELKSETIDEIIKSAPSLIALITLTETNELQKLILNSLDRFSEAISNKNLHRRLVDIFTILESLLLKNDSVIIQDSLINFGMIFLEMHMSMKDEYRSFITSMYDLRSQVIHHANHKEIDLHKLGRLQMETVNIILKLIGLSMYYPTKAQVLEAHERYIQK